MGEGSLPPNSLKRIMKKWTEPWTELGSILWFFQWTRYLYAPLCFTLDGTCDEQSIRCRVVAEFLACNILSLIEVLTYLLQVFSWAMLHTVIFTCPDLFFIHIVQCSSPISKNYDLRKAFTSNSQFPLHTKYSGHRTVYFISFWRIF